MNKWLLAMGLLASGCATVPPSYDCHDELEPFTCPTARMRLNELLIVASFEHFFFTLSQAELDCVESYRYQALTSREEVYDACWEGVQACALYTYPSTGYNTIKVWERPATMDESMRHEVMHLILWCSGEPGSGDHSHAAWPLTVQPDGSTL